MIIDIRDENRRWEEQQADDDDEVIHKTIPWPVLGDRALHGVAGEIVKGVLPYTEADPAAILVQLLAELGAIVGRVPYFQAGSSRHYALIHPLVVGTTSGGAKGTSLAVVNSIRRWATLDHDVSVVSGLSSAEGLIESIRDAVGDNPDAKGFEPGVDDKRLLVLETEYRQVIARSRREGNTLAPTVRQLWDGEDRIQTLTRSKTALRATGAHVVVIGHITPREFMSIINDADLSGGSINRLLICLSRRSKLNADMGNVPDDVMIWAGGEFKKSIDAARQGPALAEFSADFMEAWHELYPKLSAHRPDNWLTDATARAVPHVLRLALLYAIADRNDTVDAAHLAAALALWEYTEQSARWLFSDAQQEDDNSESNALVKFIRDAGEKGRTRSEISGDHFRRHKTAAEINDILDPLIHSGVIRVVEERLPEFHNRKVTRYLYVGGAAK